MNMLVKTTGLRLISAIEEGDVNYLKTLPGIGPKSASQIVLDLKGKLVDATHNKYALPEALTEAISGLRNLGYKQSELNAIEKELVKNPNQTVDEYIKAGLQLLMKMK
jgi:Holliday junction DNA helicase RuvA